MKLIAHNLIKYYGFIIILLILPTDINANKGLEIAIKSDRNFDGYEDSSSEMTMELISKKGDVVTRKLKFKRLEVPGDGDKLPDDFTEKFGSFFPIVRLSNSALKLLHELLFDGIYGYSEGFVPTILNYHGFKLDTIFDNTSKGKYFDNDKVQVKHKHIKITRETRASR